MADAVFTSTLTMTCKIQRKTPEAEPDEHGQTIDNWTDDQDTGVPCLLEWTSNVEIVEGKRVVIKGFNIMFKAGVNISEEDRIVDVVRTSGSTTVHAGPLSVIGVSLGDVVGGPPHHVEATLDFVEEN